MATTTSLPRDVSKLGQEIKLFGKWDTQEYASSVTLFSLLTNSSQRRSQGHLANRLYPSSPCRLPATHRRPLRQEAVQEGSDAYRGTIGRFVRSFVCPPLLPFRTQSIKNRLMMKGRNNGKKLMAVRIVAHAFEIIHLLTDQNPIQVDTFLLTSLPVFSENTLFCFSTL
jgi:small subunit ribosomal protein S5e